MAFLFFSFFRNEINAGFRLESLEWLVDPLDPLFSLLKSRAADEEYPLTFWVEMRIMANSDVYLSPAVGGK